MPEIHLQDFEYVLPESQIAKYPLEVRDQARLLVYQQGEIAHSYFYNLSFFLPEQTLLVFNDTKVIPARLYFRRDTGALIEVFLLEPVVPHLVSEMMQATQAVQWRCMIGNRKRWKGEDALHRQLKLGQETLALTLTRAQAEEDILHFSWQPADMRFLEVLQKFGNLPLPPYLKREVEAEDQAHYQTIYSEKEGAVAAPTAGLHFTERVMTDLQKKGIKTDFLTLHVGGGTFQPIKTAQITAHPMHLEQLVFSRQNIRHLQEKAAHIVAVGTTSLRALESLYWFGVKLQQQPGQVIPFFIEKLFPYQTHTTALPTFAQSLEAIEGYMQSQGLETLTGETEIFIFPGYTFRVCRALITNFHLPNTTLILLVAAFVGPDWRKIYEAALQKGYRFLSYGDSSLLIPETLA